MNSISSLKCLAAGAAVGLALSFAGMLYADCAQRCTGESTCPENSVEQECTNANGCTGSWTISGNPAGSYLDCEAKGNIDACSPNAAGDAPCGETTTVYCEVDETYGCVTSFATNNSAISSCTP